MTNDGTLRMRIQLKADIEDNWKAHPIVPLANELIIYTEDSTHNYARLKVGDGITPVTALPFVDAGTLNGHEAEIVKLVSFDDRPAVGSNDKLYVDLSTNKIYHYAQGKYVQLSNFDFDVSTFTTQHIISFMPGVAAKATVDNNILKITNGEIPSLVKKDLDVVTGITKEV